MSIPRVSPSRLVIALFAAALCTAPGVVWTSSVASAAAEEDALVERVRAKVVFIEVRAGRGGRTGTGFFAAPGRVLTSDHVVRDAGRITVWANGMPYAARVAGRDEHLDLAVVALPDAALLIKPLPLAEAATTQPGEPVLIVGTHRASAAAVRQIPISGRFRGPIWFEWPAHSYSRAIEISAHVEPGDSGSPVLRVRDGAVIGVVRARDADGPDGVSERAWAVPIDVAFPLLGRAVGRAQQAHRPTPDEEFYLRNP